MAECCQCHVDIEKRLWKADGNSLIFILEESHLFRQFTSMKRIPLILLYYTRSHKHSMLACYVTAMITKNVSKNPLHLWVCSNESYTESHETHWVWSGFVQCGVTHSCYMPAELQRRAGPTAYPFILSDPTACKGHRARGAGESHQHPQQIHMSLSQKLLLIFFILENFFSFFFFSCSKLISWVYIREKYKKRVFPGSLFCLAARKGEADLCSHACRLHSHLWCER